MCSVLHFLTCPDVECDVRAARFNATLNGSPLSSAAIVIPPNANNRETQRTLRIQGLNLTIDTADGAELCLRVRRARIAG